MLTCLRLVVVVLLAALPLEGVARVKHIACDGMARAATAASGPALHAVHTHGGIGAHAAAMQFASSDDAESAEGSRTGTFHAGCAYCVQCCSMTAAPPHAPPIAALQAAGDRFSEPPVAAKRTPADPLERPPRTT